jgi:23S rRNA pseudouridine2605 synthase
MAEERLQKIIAHAGVASRRAGEDLILAGRVRVNGHIVTELGAKADARADTIVVDGRRLVAEAPRYFVLHKPRGVVSTLSDPEGRPTVGDLLGELGARLYPVGRLDFATSGVLLVTNDGDFSNGLLHPRGGVPKTYVVKTKGVMKQGDLDRWRDGVELEDGRTLPADIHFLRHEEGKTWFEITLREGKNQQIRRMGEATGFPVMRLARTSFAGITSEGLRPGQSRPLTSDELSDLRKQYGVPKRVHRKEPRPAATGPGHEQSPPPRPPASAPGRDHRGADADRDRGPRPRTPGGPPEAPRIPSEPARPRPRPGGARGRSRTGS